MLVYGIISPTGIYGTAVFIYFSFFFHFFLGLLYPYYTYVFVRETTITLLRILKYVKCMYECMIYTIYTSMHYVHR